MPLEIPEHKIHGASSKEDQFDFLMNKSPRKNEWYSDPQDTVTAGWGLCLSALDLAKIGQLILCGGRYGGRQIISNAYVDETLFKLTVHPMLVPECGLHIALVAHI